MRNLKAAILGFPPSFTNSLPFSMPKKLEVSKERTRSMDESAFFQCCPCSVADRRLNFHSKT